LPILGCAPALDACDLGAMIIPSPRSPLSPTLGYSHAVHVPRCAPTPFIAPRAFIPIPFYRAQPALLPHDTRALHLSTHVLIYLTKTNFFNGSMPNSSS
jgi:hypothetical protein